MQQMEILLVILFLSRKKFYAKQICVFSSSMKLGPGVFVNKKSQAHKLAPQLLNYRYKHVSTMFE